MSLYFCPKCSKVFFFKREILRPQHCPNCRDGYGYHRSEFVPASFLAKIILEPVPIEVLKELMI